MQKKEYQCIVCKHLFLRENVVAAPMIRNSVSALIKQDYPAWSETSHICHDDLSVYRSRYVHTLLESDKGELSELEKEVLESLKKHELISSDIDNEFKQEWTFGEKMADKIAEFGGSWKFLILFAIFLFLWIIMNSLVIYWKPVDPYPFILLNLLLSCLAAIQAPIIMMSQNRQEAKDRLRAKYDYQVNLKAELEIRQIHEKLDHLMNKQWDRLVQIQEIQLEQLSEIKPNSLTKHPHS
ncbi:MAG: DUF1003 domain-containing protein [Campylobacterales bacterium]|nr:DUF1003 domain-containing protein [Campylobacterales bacterium]